MQSTAVLAVRRLRATAVVVTLALTAVAAFACSAPDKASTASPSEVAAVTGGPLVAAAGDISCPVNQASGSSCRAQATGDLVRAADPQAVLGLGDHQYEAGELANFRNDYDSTWGSFKAKHYPVPGNHEYRTPGANGYFSYFGSRAHQQAGGYYAFNMGSWRVYALNTNCAHIGCSRERSWLAADLAANPTACTLAFGHHPVHSSGLHGSERFMRSFATIMTTGGVDVYLAGHDHDYERFGAYADESFRQFVVGTGGVETRGFQDIRAHSEVRRRAFGIALFRLRTDSYTWRFREIDGNKTDSGTDSCA